MTHTDKRGGAVYVLGAMLIFGAYILFVSPAQASPAAYVFAMQVVGMIAFGAASLAYGFPKITPKYWGILLVLAASTLLNDWAYFRAFQLTSAANAAFSHQLVSVFLLFLAPVFLGEKTRREEYIALCISLPGLVLLFSEGLRLSAGDREGIMWGVVSAACYAVFTLIYRYLPDRPTPDGRVMKLRLVNFWRYTLGTAALLPYMVVSGEMYAVEREWPTYLFFGLLFAVIASGLHHIGMHRARPLYASVIGKTEPAIVVLYGFLFLGQVPSLRQTAGGVIVLGASLWLGYNEGKFREHGGSHASQGTGGRIRS